MLMVVLTSDGEGGASVAGTKDMTTDKIPSNLPGQNISLVKDLIERR